MASNNFFNRKISIFFYALEQAFISINFLLILKQFNIGRALMDSIKAKNFKYTLILAKKRLNYPSNKLMSMYSYKNKRNENI